MKTEKIVNNAIERWNPSTVILAVSGGYDSMCMAHYVHKNMTFDRPLITYAIDTQLAADGWRDYMLEQVAPMCEDFRFIRTPEFDNYLSQIEKYGQPRSRRGHKNIAYRYLKDRAFAEITRNHKREWQGRNKRFDKILFLSGIRKHESAERSKFESPFSENGRSGVWANPLFYWTNEQLLAYRIENELPVNPFYETVGGSGDCQCNWGAFITMRKLQKYSPELAAGNVATIDKLSKKHHGYGWDHQRAGQMEMLVDFEDKSELCSPFLCEGCSRSKTPKPGKQKAEEMIYEQAQIF